MAASLTAVLPAAPGAITHSAADVPNYAETTNVYDSMARDVPRGFGTADMGGAYATNPTPKFSVSSGAGHIASIEPGSGVRAILAATTTDDEKLQSTFSLPSLPTDGNGVYYGHQFRRQSDGDEYDLQVRVTPGGQMILSFRKVRNGENTGIGGQVVVPQVATPGATVVFQGLVAGSDTVGLAARAWLLGSDMPDWQLGATDRTPDRLTDAGQTGLYVYTSSSTPEATNVSVEAVQGWQLTPPATPAPSSPSPTSASPTSASPAPTPPASTPPTPEPETSAPHASAPTSAPPTSTPPTTTPTAGSGAVALGTANYPIPAGVVFVSPSGNDASGTGSLQDPFATVSRGVAASPSGGTVVLRAGSYNEYLFVGKTVTIQNYPGEVAWMDGSVPVGGWTRSGSTWIHTGWNHSFDHSASFDCGSNSGGFVNTAHPMAAYPDQVFFDGGQQVQVSANPGPGQFAVNYSSGTIVTGSDPTGHQVRASNVQQAFVVGGSDVVIRGIGVRNYATSLCQMGTVYLGGSGGGDVLQNLVFTGNATQPLAIDAPGTMADHLTVQGNGMTGIHANAADGSTIANSLITDNNTQAFNNTPATAGIKITRLDGFTIRNNTVSDNPDANGIWTDENVTKFVIVGNTVTNRNGEYGILTELSDTGIVANNTISSAKYGYTAFDSGNVQVFNNTFERNKIWDLGLSQDNRYQPGKSTAGVLPSAIDRWVVKNVVAANNDFTRSTATYEYYVLDKETNRTADSMNLTIDGNAFLARGAGSGSWPIAWGAGDNTTLTTFATPQALEIAKGTAWVNASLAPGTKTPVPSGESYAVPLPSNVAQALGVATGTQRVGAF
ncbi:MAG: hypothetical protein DLM58_24450 [Pseudonocardiales bacterium]|nr:MAG: hypothetical protein DLM58_24450 [Pseudonocardiales bacterium]